MCREDIQYNRHELMYPYQTDKCWISYHLGFFLFLLYRSEETLLFFFFGWLWGVQHNRVWASPLSKSDSRTLFQMNGRGFKKNTHKKTPRLTDKIKGHSVITRGRIPAAVLSGLSVWFHPWTNQNLGSDLCCHERSCLAGEMGLFNKHNISSEKARSEIRKLSFAA